MLHDILPSDSDEDEDNEKEEEEKQKKELIKCHPIIMTATTIRTTKRR